MGQTKLSKDERIRYCRQTVLPGFRLEGQIKLKNSSVLIVGAGGLGCPVGLYLAGAGIGRVGIVDHDEVEITNLHRQIAHTEARVGSSKAESLAKSMKDINHTVFIETYKVRISEENAMEMVEKYDLVVDATDNVVARYLLNDVCVLSNKPLVSGAALRLDGQITTYHFKGGPCYRCVHPIPPPATSVMGCDISGVLGPVPGMIGCLQAMEAIQILSRGIASYSGRMLVFSGDTAVPRVLKLRGRRPDCDICGDSPNIRSLINYEQFCQSHAIDQDEHLTLLGPEDRITAEELYQMLESGRSIHIIDVRGDHDFDTFGPGCSNGVAVEVEEIPLTEIENSLAELAKMSTTGVVIAMCRRGNDSQRVVKILKERNIKAKDVVGGMHEYARKIDPNAINIRSYL